MMRLISGQWSLVVMVSKPCMYRQGLHTNMATNQDRQDARCPSNICRTISEAGDKLVRIHV